MAFPIDSLTDEEIDELLRQWDEADQLEINYSDNKDCAGAPPIQKKFTGCHCIGCKEFFEFAEPNQKDGSFKCFSCRNY